MSLHTSISYLKSTFRIAGFAWLWDGHIKEACICLIIAEVLGIAEELPGTYKGTEL